MPRPDGPRQRKISQRPCPLILLAAVLALGPAAAAAYEFHPNGWTVPQVYGATRYSDEYFDFDPNVPGTETRLERFQLPNGIRVYRYSHNGHVFSYVVDVDGLDPPDYELVDYDGSGAFEIKQSPYNEYPLPKWTFKPYEYPLLGGGKVTKEWPAQSLTAKNLAAALSGEGAGPGRVSLSVQFEFNSDVLTPQAQTILDQLGAALVSKKLEGVKFLIEGHTDAVGGLEYNQSLSERRALAAKQYLTANFNLDPNRLETRGKGESEPLPGFNPEDGANRRVEVVNLGPVPAEPAPPPEGGTPPEAGPEPAAQPQAAAPVTEAAPAAAPVTEAVPAPESETAAP
ncbi:MAG: OmpA family protein [Thermodesulfobacteriota bacterium]